MIAVTMMIMVVMMMMRMSRIVAKMIALAMAMRPLMIPRLW